MGVVILGSAVSQPTASPFSHGARRLADRAAKDCLEGTDRRAGDIDLLVNVGVYRERGLGEPALAALIQQDVDANAGEINGTSHGTFSFDIDNGLCGVLTGMDVVRGFLVSGAIRTGMVVASDSGPDPVHARDLPRPEAGAALLLGSAEAVPGLSAVALRTYPEYAGLLEGYWEWQPRRLAHPRSRGTNRLVVQERPGFADRAVECATDATGDFLSAAGVDPRAVDLVVATPAGRFADELAEALGIDRHRVLHVGEQLGRMHSAAPAAGIHLARRTGRWSAARTILLVTAGAGITVASALYRCE